MKLLKILGILMLLGVVASVFLGGRKTEQAKPVVSQPVQPTLNPQIVEQQKRDIENGKAIIESNKERAIYAAAKPFEEKNYPRWYEKFGKEGMKEINGMLLGVSKSVASNSACDQISYIGISDKSNSVNPIFFADCENGKRFMTSKIEIKQGLKPTLEN